MRRRHEACEAIVLAIDSSVRLIRSQARVHKLPERCQDQKVFNAINTVGRESLQILYTFDAMLVIKNVNSMNSSKFKITFCQE